MRGLPSRSRATSACASVGRWRWGPRTAMGAWRRIALVSPRAWGGGRAASRAAAGGPASPGHAHGARLARSSQRRRDAEARQDEHGDQHALLARAREPALARQQPALELPLREPGLPLARVRLLPEERAVLVPSEAERHAREVDPLRHADAEHQVDR